MCEDAWFALVAMEAGYTIDFVDGDMMERSPFTLSDFMKQVSNSLPYSYQALEACKKLSTIAVFQSIESTIYFCSVNDGCKEYTWLFFQIRP